jgi:hypothetical protein
MWWVRVESVRRKLGYIYKRRKGGTPKWEKGFHFMGLTDWWDFWHKVRSFFTLYISHYEGVDVVGHFKVFFLLSSYHEQALISWFIDYLYAIKHKINPKDHISTALWKQKRFWGHFVLLYVYNQKNYRVPHTDLWQLMGFSAFWKSHIVNLEVVLI